MRTGLMRRQITLRTMTQTPNPMGGYTETVSDIAGIPARVEPLEGRELIEAMQTGMQRPYRFTIRYREGVHGSTTLLYDSRTFDIKSIQDPEAKHRELQLMTDEVNA